MSNNENENDDKVRILPYVPTTTQYPNNRAAEETMRFFAKRKISLRIKGSALYKYPKLEGKKVILSSGDPTCIPDDTNPVFFFHCYPVDDERNLYSVELDDMQKVPGTDNQNNNDGYAASGSDRHRSDFSERVVNAD